MKTLDFYISKLAFKQIILVLSIILGLDLVFSFINELEDRSQTYGFLQIAYYCLMQAPEKIDTYLPLCVMIGFLNCLGTLASNSELTVMMASGISRARIVLAGTVPVLLMVGVNFYISEAIAPDLHHYAEFKKQVFNDIQVGPDYINGYWQKEGYSFVHVNKISPDGHLSGISRFMLTENGSLDRIIFSERGENLPSSMSAHTQWQLKDIMVTTFSKKQIETVEYDSSDWYSTMTPEMLNISLKEAQFLSLQKLKKFIRYLKIQQLSAAKYQTSFWRKALQPIATICLMFLSAAFIFGPLRRTSMGLRILLGISVGMGFIYLQELSGHFSLAFGVAPVLAASLPIATFSVVTILLFTKKN